MVNFESVFGVFVPYCVHEEETSLLHISYQYFLPSLDINEVIVSQINQIVAEFATRFVEKIDCLSKKQKSEVIGLLDLRLALGRYEMQLGKSATQIKILRLWKSR